MVLPTPCSYPTGNNWKTINYYSGSNLFDTDGDATGTKGDDNARVLNERRFVYQDIGDESEKCIEGSTSITPKKQLEKKLMSTALHKQIEISLFPKC